MNTYTDQEFSEAKAKHGEVIEMTLPDFDFCALVLPFTRATGERYVDEGAGGRSEDANERLLVRHVLWPSPAALEAAKKRCPRLASCVADVLCEDAGLPLTPPARVMSEALDEATPSGVLAYGGLDDGKMRELLREHVDAKLRLVVVRDVENHVILSCVLATPGEAEMGLLEGPRGKGYAQACLSAARGCIVWSREDFDKTIERYPVLPALVLAPILLEMGGAGAARRFRRRR